MECSGGKMDSSSEMLTAFVPECWTNVQQTQARREARLVVQKKANIQCKNQFQSINAILWNSPIATWTQNTTVTTENST